MHNDDPIVTYDDAARDSKIQYVVPNSLANSTFGVSGQTTTGESYLTGYIELGLGEGQTAGPGAAGGPAPVAHYGR
jgi:hypothetical protein